MLFANITEIKTFLPIGAGNDFNRLKPHIANAENKYLKPLLGNNLFDEMQEFYDTQYPLQPTEVQIATKTLLEKIQHALIHLAYFGGFDFLNTAVSDAGFQRTESENLKGLYKYQEDNLKKYFSDAGFNGLDDVLVFIEENISCFTEFKASENWTVLKDNFLPTVKTVENIPFNIHSSRLIFLSLKPHLAYIEDTSIKQTLGETIYGEIKAEMIKDSPAAKVISILPYIRKPLIYLASALLMEESGAELGEKGLFFEKTKSIYRGNNIKEPSTPQTIALMVSRNRAIGLSYLDALKSYLVENNSLWPDYNGQTGPLFSRDNTDKKTFWT
jgi:hypothetical protein